jgi:hypothetical protein
LADHDRHRCRAPKTCAFYPFERMIA